MSCMTPLQRLTAKQKVVRLNRINEYYLNNHDASIKQAVTFIPESSALVQQYSKLRRELVIDGDQDEITPEDIDEYVFGLNPLRYRQIGRRDNMLHELKKEQRDRLRRFDDLKSHISDKDNRRMYISRPDKIKITAEQVKKVKRLLGAGMSMVAIQNLTKLSEYHVRGVRRGRYDSLLESCEVPHRQTSRR